MSAPADRTLLSSRLFPAGPADLLRALAEPERLARWWGPRGFRNRFHAFSFTEGGEWRFDMTGPDGTVYPNHNVFERITPDRIRLRHLDPAHGFGHEMTLEEEEGGTRLCWRMEFDSAEECARVRPFIPRCNEENFDRLETELGRLAGEAGDGRELRLVRLLDVSPERAYRCWTEGDLLVKWFTPPPWVTLSAELDVRPGGAQHVVMRGPGGAESPHRGVYLEVVPNRRLVWTDAFTRAWEPSAKPFVTAILTFEDLGGRTRYTARVLHWTAADREAHEQMGFHLGWGVATDQLVAVAAAL